MVFQAEGRAIGIWQEPSAFEAVIACQDRNRYRLGPFYPRVLHASQHGVREILDFPQTVHIKHRGLQLLLPAYPGPVQAGDEGDPEAVPERLPAGEGQKAAGAGLYEDNGDRREMPGSMNRFCRMVSSISNSLPSGW